MRELKIITTLGLYLIVFPGYALDTLTCMSENNAFQRCALSQADQRDIRIKSVKSGDCNQNNAWGVDSSGIWVSKDCGAVFEYTEVASSAGGNTDENSGGIYIAPGFTGPYYGPGFYYGAGFYDYNGWGPEDYCQNGGCNRAQQHQNEEQNRQFNDEVRGSEFRGGGGYHGGGGGRR